VVALRPRTRRQRRHRNAIAAARARLDQVRDEIKDLGRAGQPVIAGEREAVVAGLMDNRRQLARLSGVGSVPATAPMEIDRWVLWRPDRDASLDEVRVGALREGIDGESLGVPCVVPIVPGQSIVIVNHNDRQRATARGLWSSMVTRVAALAAGRVELVLIDPTGAAADHRLFTTVVSGVEVPRALDRLSREVPPEGGRLIAIPDLPLGLGPRDAALVLAMIREGVAGATLVVHLDAEFYRSEIGEPDLGGASSRRWLVDVAPPTVADPSAGLSVIWDAAPPPALVDLIVDRLASG